MSGQLRALRRLLYCGEWIESHTLHIFMLHAPDFLGVPSAVELAKINPELVEMALRLKKIGNEVMRVVGGREVHPINVKVGGWYKTPTRAQLDAMVPDLEWAKASAIATVGVVAGLDFPELEQDYEFVALDADGEYPIDRGARLISNRGLDIPISEFYDNIEEDSRRALQRLARAPARARLLPRRPPCTLRAASRVALPRRTRGGRRGRARTDRAQPVPVDHRACRRARARLRRGAAADRRVRGAGRLRRSRSSRRPGWGHGASEAPRGVLYHRYRLGPDGGILDAKIVPPTSQNQQSIEEDLFAFVSAHAELPEEELRLRCEQAIRNYDPCISCATHFLTLDIDRE